MERWNHGLGFPDPRGRGGGGEPSPNWQSGQADLQKPDRFFVFLGLRFGGDAELLMYLYEGGSVGAPCGWYIADVYTWGGGNQEGLFDNKNIFGRGERLKRGNSKNKKNQMTC